MNAPAGVERILLLMDNRADSNWGSQASTGGLVELLGERFPGARIEGLPRSVARPRSKFVRRRLSELAPRVLRQGDWDSLFASFVMRPLTRRWIDRARAADLIVVNGEGTLHPQRQTRLWLPVLGLLRHACRAPLWIVNASVMCRGDRDEDLFVRVLASADHVAVREPESHRELQALGIRHREAFDCAVLTRPAPAERVDRLLESLGISGPFAVLTGSATVRDWHLGAQRRLIEVLRQAGLAVLYASSEPEDEETHRRLGLALPLLSHREADHRDLMGVQARARLLVGGRFHPTLLAALSGTPFVAVTSNTHKMRGLMESLGAEDSLFDLGDDRGQLEAVRARLADRDARGAMLARRALELIERARINVEPETTTLAPPPGERPARSEISAS